RRPARPRALPCTARRAPDTLADPMPAGHACRPLILANVPPSALVTNLCVAFLCLIWGSTWVVIAEGLQDLPPLTSAGARFVLAFLTRLVLASRLARRVGGAAPPAWLWVLVGVCNFAVTYGITYAPVT